MSGERRVKGPYYHPTILTIPSGEWTHPDVEAYKDA